MQRRVDGAWLPTEEPTNVEAATQLPRVTVIDGECNVPGPTLGDGIAYVFTRITETSAEAQFLWQR